MNTKQHRDTARQMGIKASGRFFEELAGRKAKPEAPKVEAPMSDEERAAVKAEIARIKRIYLMTKDNRSPSHPEVVAERNARKEAERARQLEQQRRHGNVNGNDRFWRELERAHGR